MNKKNLVWVPEYKISTKIAGALMTIESSRTIVENMYLPPAIEEELRHRARVRSTHYSTRIEGNRLLLKEAEAVVEKKKTQFHGRERDVKEVKNYWDALLKIEEWTSNKMDLTETLIMKLHAMVERGKRAKATPYRNAQNVIRDSADGAIVYLPPEAKDVPSLMLEMVRWVRKAEKEKVPVPIIAALLHYQFVTIHPYYDGNGRTARLLATFILQRDGYGLNGFFSLEEHHARDLSEYYKTLATHKHHNYYEGRANVDLTSWVQYFTCLLAKVFILAKDEAVSLAQKGVKQEPAELRKLDRRARQVFALFSKQDRITARDAANVLGLTPRMARILLQKWVCGGWLKVKDRSNRSRSYTLSEIYRKLIVTTFPFPSKTTS